MVKVIGKKFWNKLKMGWKDIRSDRVSEWCSRDYSKIVGKKFRDKLKMDWKDIHSVADSECRLYNMIMIMLFL